MGSVGFVIGQDQFDRRERFCERHPDVRFGFDSGLGHNATYRDPSDDALRTTTWFPWLKHLLDYLERVYGEYDD